MNQSFIVPGEGVRFRRFARKAWSVFNSLHRVVTIGVVAGYVLLFAPGVRAEHRPEVAPDSVAGWELSLDELVVSSAAAEAPLLQSARPVVVVTQADIERQPAQTVADLLKNVAGIDVRQRGGNGVQADVSVRGGTFDQIAILLNGINLTSPHTGHYALDLPVNFFDIERIEIVQGPASLLYGAGALAGGINIITKKNAPTGIDVKAEGGMFQLHGGEARGTWRLPTASHSVSAGYHAAAGYRYNTDYRIFQLFGQSRFEADQATLDLQWGLNDKAYGANSFYSPIYLDQFDDTRTYFAAVKAEAGTRLKLTPRLYWHRHYDCFQLFRDGTPEVPAFYTGPNYHYSEVFGVGLTLLYPWRGGITRFGGEMRNEGIFSNQLGKDTVRLGRYLVRDNRTQVAYFLEHSYRYRNFTLSVGVSADYNTAFSHRVKFYPCLNAAYLLDDGRIRLFASWNNATRTPTFTDLYYTAPDLTGFSGLQPERSEAYEAGVQYRPPWMSFTLTGFYEKGRNLIDWIRSSADDPVLRAANLTAVDKTGLEVRAAVPLGNRRGAGSRLHIGYLYLHQTRDAGPWISNYVMDHLRHRLTAGFSHPLAQGLSADWEFRFQDRAGTFARLTGKDEAGQTLWEETPYPPYALLDLKLIWKKDRLQLFLEAQNLLNTAYYDRGNIPQPGAWITGGIVWHWR
jgi:iron complex outermembrane receptor protein